MDKNESSKFYARYKNIFRGKTWVTTLLLNFWFYTYNEKVISWICFILELHLQVRVETSYISPNQQEFNLIKSY